MTGLCCHICFHPQVWCTAHDLNAFKMYLNVSFYIFNALTAAYNGRSTTVNLSFNKCATLLRRHSVLRFLSNILKTCFILKKQNTINNNIIPVSETHDGNLMCGFVLSTLWECLLCQWCSRVLPRGRIWIHETKEYNTSALSLIKHKYSTAQQERTEEHTDDR